MLMHLSTKGQVTIPLEVREQAGLGPGSAVEITWDDGRVVMVPAPSTASNRSQAAVRRLTGSATIRMTTDEIMALTRGED